jgi:integrase
MARKRSNGEGSIFYRASRNRWEAVLVVDRGADGRPRRRTFTAKTRKEVTVKLAAASAALESGLAIPDGRTTFAEFSAWWASRVLPGEGLAPKTERFYRDTLTCYVLPAVGQRTLSGPKALTPGDIEAMTGDLLAAGYSHRVAEAARVTTGKVLRAAEARGLVARNVARIAKAPRDRGEARPVKALTLSEVAELLGRLDGGRWYPVVVVGVTTGLRPGELLALHWADVHLSDTEPRLSVRYTLTHVDGPALKAPKRERSYRSVPLAAEAVTVLRAWRKQQAAEHLTAGETWTEPLPGLVFTAATGAPRRIDTYRQALNRAAPGVHPHRLRHTYATHLLEAGVPIHHVAELLGDTVATVESTYSHVLRVKQEAANVASGLLAH